VERVGKGRSSQHFDAVLVVLGAGDAAAGESAGERAVGVALWGNELSKLSEK
jgi:hypothetical protein